jgi:hypothetical protein
LHEVVETSRARIGETLFIGGKLQIISRIPLRNREGKIIGAIGKGMLHHELKVLEIQKHLEFLHNKLKYYKDEISNLKGSRVLFGQSDLIQNTRKLALQVSGSDIPARHPDSDQGTGEDDCRWWEED